MSNREPFKVFVDCRDNGWDYYSPDLQTVRHFDTLQEGNTVTEQSLKERYGCGNLSLFLEFS